MAFSWLALLGLSISSQQFLKYAHPTNVFPQFQCPSYLMQRMIPILLDGSIVTRLWLIRSLA